VKPHQTSKSRQSKIVQNYSYLTENVVALMTT
jgi:hypothetical protein